jgi:RHS repeat-associated protein
VDAATNRLSNAVYDLNGNMTSGAGAALGYDEANRIRTASAVSGGTEYYGYAPDNKRVFRKRASGTMEMTFYGLRGEKLAQCTFNGGSAWWTCGIGQIWFAGKLIWDAGGTVTQDRLGTNRAGGARYYPYGEEITSTANDKVKFGTYTRDGYTGLDYADQRFYASSYGRFSTPDPYQAAAKGANSPNDPGTWNRYSYVAGDPANRVDPTGQMFELTCTGADGFSSIDSCFGGGAGFNDCSSNGFLSTPACGNYPPYNPPEQWAPVPTCDQTETAYLTTYLNQRNSPLAAYASEFVEFSDIQGIDDRFIVALAGVESTYGKAQNPAGSGQYNAFSNGAHCAALGVNAYCRTVNPYTDFGQAIADVINLIGSGKRYEPYSSTQNIYSIYERGDINVISGNQGLLDRIYGVQMKGDVSDVRKPRCP